MFTIVHHLLECRWCLLQFLPYPFLLPLHHKHLFGNVYIVTVVRCVVSGFRLTAPTTSHLRNLWFPRAFVFNIRNKSFPTTATSQMRLARARQFDWPWKLCSQRELLAAGIRTGCPVLRWPSSTTPAVVLCPHLPPIISQWLLMYIFGTPFIVAIHCFSMAGQHQHCCACWIPKG
jgi:hypothetical protein